MPITHIPDGIETSKGQNNNGDINCGGVFTLNSTLSAQSTLTVAMTANTSEQTLGLPITIGGTEYYIVLQTATS